MPTRLTAEELCERDGYLEFEVGTAGSLPEEVRRCLDAYAERQEGGRLTNPATGATVEVVRYYMASYRVREVGAMLRPAESLEGCPGCGVPLGQHPPGPPCYVLAPHRKVP